MKGRKTAQVAAAEWIAAATAFVEKKAHQDGAEDHTAVESERLQASRSHPAVIAALGRVTRAAWTAVDANELTTEEMAFALNSFADSLESRKSSGGGGGGGGGGGSGEASFDRSLPPIPIETVVASPHPRSESTSSKGAAEPSQAKSPGRPLPADYVEDLEGLECASDNEVATDDEASPATAPTKGMGFQQVHFIFTRYYIYIHIYKYKYI